MKNEIKKIFNYIGAFFLGIFSIIGCYLFHNRRTVDGVGEQLDGIGEKQREQAERIERIADGVERVAEGERTDAERIERSKKILEEIRKQKQAE